MTQTIVLASALGYVLLLFAIASYGDRRGARGNNQPRPYVYAFSLAIYCTSWTFFGSVGLASERGLARRSFSHSASDSFEGLQGWRNRNG